MREKMEGFQNFITGRDTVPSSVCLFLVEQVIQMIDAHTYENPSAQRKRKNDEDSGDQNDSKRSRQNNSNGVHTDDGTSSPANFDLAVHHSSNNNSPVKLMFDQPRKIFYYCDRGLKRPLTELLTHLPSVSPGQYEHFRINANYLTLDPPDVNELIQIHGTKIKIISLSMGRGPDKIQRVRDLLFYQLPNLQELFLDIPWMKQQQPLSPSTTIEKLPELPNLKRLVLPRSISSQLVLQIVRGAVNLERYERKAQRFHDDQDHINLLLELKMMHTIKVIVIDPPVDSEKLDYLEKVVTHLTDVTAMAVQMNDNFDVGDKTGEKARKITKSIFAKCIDTLETVFIHADQSQGGIVFWREVQWPTFPNVKNLTMDMKYCRGTEGQTGGTNFGLPPGLEDIFPGLQTLYVRLEAANSLRAMAMAPFEGSLTTVKTIKFLGGTKVIPAPKEFVEGLKRVFPEAEIVLKGVNN